MMALIAGSFFAVALIAAIGGLFELRTAVRLATAKKNDLKGLGAIEATVKATDGVLESPLEKHRCVMFTLLLLRRRLHEQVGAGALFFNEVRPFSLVMNDGTTFAIDQKKEPVYLLGLPVVEKPLPFLPQTIAGLLIQRFGRKGHIWAEEHVVRAQETTLDDGAKVYALADGGSIKMLSTTPLHKLARAAAVRGAAGVAFGVVGFAFFWFFH